HRDFGRQNYYTLYVDEGQIPALAEANLVKISGARDATAANLFDYNEGRDIIGYEPREPGEYFIRNIDEAVKAWQAGGISLNLLQWYTRGIRTTDPNGEVILV